LKSLKCGSELNQFGSSFDGSMHQPLEAPNIQESIPNAECGPLMLPPLLDEMVIHHI
jgi:hypothetical protein